MGSRANKSRPSVTVVLPAHNAADTLDRAIRSVLSQSLAAWELLAVDDGSSDGSAEIIRRYAETDSRIRLLRTTENSGAAAARNVALASASGSIIAYLDADDEFHPDYLNRAADAASSADVLVCGYDLVFGDGTTTRIARWSPADLRHRLFEKNFATPLGVSHRRGLVETAGGFNELVTVEADWDLWKRLARAGARFRFLEGPAGRYHVREESLSRRPHVPETMRRKLLANRAAGRPLFADGQPSGARRAVKTVAFASAHCLIDSGSGAAIATHRALRLLTGIGFSCHAFCGARLDTQDEGLVEEALARRGWQHEVRNVAVGTKPARLLFADLDGVAGTIFLSASTRAGVAPEEGEVFLAAFDRFLDSVGPDVLLTYGGDPASQAMTRAAKRRDIPVVFGLHNFAYEAAEAFTATDYVAVPSAFAAARYWDRLGLYCHVLPNVVECVETRVSARRPKFVTFVNPQPTKGVYVFFRIASELARLRPEIPLLVVESRGQVEALRRDGLDLASLANVSVLPNAHRPADFYEETMLLLAPSLWDESFGLVAAEALLNGIPVLASDRGSLPEVVGDGGILLNIPERYTPKTREAPAAEEVAAWVETILRLYDDPRAYAAACGRARHHAERWDVDRLGQSYRDFFANVRPQPVAPLAPAGVR
jgi:glycosyltransferase involved in cell wall biosynthesis/GT2 family glycosyltransferase